MTTEHLRVVERPMIAKSKSFSASVKASKSDYFEYKQSRRSKCCSDIIHHATKSSPKSPIIAFDEQNNDNRLSASLSMKKKSSFIPTAPWLAKGHSDENTPSASPNTSRMSYATTSSSADSVKPIDNACSGAGTVRGTVRRRNSFMPHFRRSSSFGNTEERQQQQYQSPLKGIKRTLPVLVGEDHDDESQIIDIDKTDPQIEDHINNSKVNGNGSGDSVNASEQSVSTTKRGSLFRPAGLIRSKSISPKSVVGNTTATTTNLLTKQQQNVLKPPLVRNLSFSDTGSAFTTCYDDSDNGRSNVSTPTLTSISSSDILQIQDEQSIETVATTTSIPETAGGIVTITTFNNDTVTAAATNRKDDVQSLVTTIGTFVLHYLILIGSACNVRALMNTIWRVSFDILVEAFTLSLDVMSYSISLLLRILETTMLWFVRQVYIRSIFIFLHNLCKNRKKDNSASGDNPNEQQRQRTFDLSQASSNSFNDKNGGNGNSTKRPMRFLYITKDMVRRKNVHTGSYKD